MLRHTLITTQLLHQARDAGTAQAEAEEKLGHQARAISALAQRRAGSPGSENR
jgi:hypothetical protein